LKPSRCAEIRGAAEWVQGVGGLSSTGQPNPVRSTLLWLCLIIGQGNIVQFISVSAGVLRYFFDFRLRVCTGSARGLQNLFTTSSRPPRGSVYVARHRTFHQEGRYAERGLDGHSPVPVWETLSGPFSNAAASPPGRFAPPPTGRSRRAMEAGCPWTPRRTASAWRPPRPSSCWVGRCRAVSASPCTRCGMRPSQKPGPRPCCGGISFGPREVGQEAGGRGRPGCQCGSTSGSDDPIAKEDRYHLFMSALTIVLRPKPEPLPAGSTSGFGVV
jgi:hypothetical protein